MKTPQYNFSATWKQIADNIWIFYPWASLGFIEVTEKGYRVVNYNKTGRFHMGVEKVSSSIVWRKTLEEAKTAFISRLNNYENRD